MKWVSLSVSGRHGTTCRGEFLVPSHISPKSQSRELCARVRREMCSNGAGPSFSQYRLGRDASLPEVLVICARFPPSRIIPTSRSLLSPTISATFRTSAFGLPNPAPSVCLGGCLLSRKNALFRRAQRCSSTILHRFNTRCSKQRPVGFRTPPKITICTPKVYRSASHQTKDLRTSCHNRNRS